MKGILLLSDGIDSPVAGSMMLKQGLELVFLNLGQASDDEAFKKVKRLARLLDKDTVLIRKNNRQILERISRRCNARYRCILCKREMYRTAERIAHEEGAEFIVTGESLGQVASQTPENLFVLDSAVHIPVLRPLLGFDKNEIVSMARRIGTYEISISKSRGCGYVPRSPVTKARIEKVIIEERKLL